MAIVGFPMWLGDRRSWRRKMLEAFEAGFSYVELSLDYPWPLPDRETPKAIVAEAKKLGLDMVFHGCWRDVKLSSPIGCVREASVSYVIDVVEAAGEIYPTYFILHLSTDQAVDQVEGYEDLFVEAATSSLKEVLKAASKVGMEIVIENDPAHFMVTVDQVVSVLERFDDVRFCFDVGHAYAYAARRGRDVDVNELVESWLKALDRKTVGAHVYDCIVRDHWVEEHVTPSEKSQLIQAFVKAARSKPVKLNFITVEAFRKPDGSPARFGELKDIVKLLTDI
ncbi:MAG: hypothetical protein DRJ31_02810 [Candidatus Methanomethylicota archaeon]|uniref:Xylose isomerase-like TIM barrel domain-containing protein n=1 Tax=Thermoproteota archaeon TaxID=2056631 RepID=A0A497ETS4_9CREN|nr:MAG: hypothetical protein DRJ31_02810 [Candidatus Verstraetearchaeota archaeon]